MTDDGMRGGVLRFGAAAVTGGLVAAAVTFLVMANLDMQEDGSTTMKATSAAGHVMLYDRARDLYNCDDYRDTYGASVQWRTRGSERVQSQFNRAGAGTCQYISLTPGDQVTVFRSCLSKVHRTVMCGAWMRP